MPDFIRSLGSPRSGYRDRGAFGRSGLPVALGIAVTTFAVALSAPIPAQTSDVDLIELLGGPASLGRLEPRKVTLFTDGQAVVEAEGKVRTTSREAKLELTWGAQSYRVESLTPGIDVTSVREVNARSAEGTPVKDLPGLVRANSDRQAAVTVRQSGEAEGAKNDRETTLRGVLRVQDGADFFMVDRAGDRTNLVFVRYQDLLRVEIADVPALVATRDTTRRILIVTFSADASDVAVRHSAIVKGSGWRPEHRLDLPEGASGEATLSTAALVALGRGLELKDAEIALVSGPLEPGASGAPSGDSSRTIHSLGRFTLEAQTEARFPLARASGQFVLIARATLGMSDAASSVAAREIVRYSPAAAVVAGPVLIARGGTPLASLTATGAAAGGSMEFDLGAARGVSVRSHSTSVADDQSTSRVIETTIADGLSYASVEVEAPVPGTPRVALKDASTGIVRDGDAATGVVRQTYPAKAGTHSLTIPYRLPSPK